MSSLYLRHETLSPGVACVYLEGSLDSHTARDLVGFFEELSDDYHKIVLRVKGLTSISATGAGVLLGKLEDARNSGGEIILVGPREDILAVFHRFGLTKLFRIVSTVEDALAILASLSSRDVRKQP